MGCQIYSSNPQILYRIPKKKPIHFSPFSSVQSKLRIQTKTIASSYNNQNQNQTFSTTTITQTELPKTDIYTVAFRTLGACRLGISRYPDFDYNAEGGKGSGRCTKIVDNGSDGITSVDFDIKTLYIPSLTTATTKLLGLPLPPFLKIEIVPEIFRGSINQESGQVDLEFKAKFWFSVGNIYRAPPLLVVTVLTSEEANGTIRSGRGQRLNEEGRCRLVGVATVEPINDFFVNSFLGLPTECLANLNAIISFPSS